MSVSGDSGVSTVSVLVLVLTTIILGCGNATVQNGTNSTGEDPTVAGVGVEFSVVDLDPIPLTSLSAPKIRIVAQHLILADEDYRRRAGPVAADVDNNDSRQDSTLEVVTDTPNSAVVMEERLYRESVVHLECVAPYPVEWEYKGEGYPDPVLSFLERKRNSGNYSDPSTYTYSSKLDMITLSERNTGRYTCRGVGVTDEFGFLEVKEAYFYIYVPGKSVFVTAQPAVKSEATPPDAEGDPFTLLLPCTVSNPNTTLDLFKIDKRSSYIHSIRGASYDPSRGFTLKTFTPWGIYVCITTDKKRLMMAFAKPERKAPAGSPEVRPKFSYDADRDRFLCCTNTSQTREGLRPEMRYVPCSSEPECQIRKHGPGQRYPYGQPLTSFSKDQVCVAMQANVTRTRRPKAEVEPPNARTLVSTRDKGPAGPPGGMFQCRIGANVDDHYFVWTKTDPDGEPVLSPDTDTNTDTVTDDVYLKFMELVLKISSTSGAEKNQVPRSVPVRVECNYNSFIFTKGHVWLFGFQNGTSVVVERELIATNHFYAEPTGDDDSGDEGGLREFTTIAFPHTNITSLICSVPVVGGLGDADWKNVTTPVTVVDHDQ